MPNSLAILGSAFDDDARGRAVGNWAAAGALTGALGPLIGGWLVDASTWRVIFLLNLLIAAAAAWLTWFYVFESKDLRKEVPVDWAGALTATAALGLLTWSLTSGAQAQISPSSIWLGGAAGLSLLGGFVWLEARRGDAAIMPLAMFGTLTFVGLTLLTLLLYASLGGLLVLLPYFLIQAAGYSAMTAGAAILPLPILIGVGSPLTAKITALYDWAKPRLRCPRGWRGNRKSPAVNSRLQGKRNRCDAGGRLSGGAGRQGRWHPNRHCLWHRGSSRDGAGQ
jgi:MFS family permease